jgi:apolipoprotein N-acyltransferase
MSRNWRRPWNTTLGLGLLGSLLLWAAFPPLQWWPLAWVAPLPWLMLVRRTELGAKLAALSRQEDSGGFRYERRPYLKLWLAGFVFWMAAVHWLRLPHPATSLGWIALSFYLAFYLPVFVWLTRIATHQLRISIVLAAPVVWTGLELARGHLLTGFSMALLGHALVHVPPLIQIADLAGAYAVSFVIMLSAACLARMFPCGEERGSYWPLAPLLAVLNLTLGYGLWRLHEDQTQPGPKVALIQGSFQSEFKADPNRNNEIHDRYLGLSFGALGEAPDIDLIVWPETMCRHHLLSYDDDSRPPADAPWTMDHVRLRAAESYEHLRSMARILGKDLLLGIDTTHFGRGQVAAYNSAVFVDRQGNVTDRYDKMHPVMFGEYVPLAGYFPWLYRATPLTGGIEAGTRLPAFRVGQARLAANICFESAVPHLIRGQVQSLRTRGEEPHVLVNLTNDGWFRGSSELDMHLACGVFRAVELRKPFLVAANTGFSAWIDSNGRIVEQGPRADEDTIIADVRLDRRTSPYLLVGDWPAGLCLVCCVALAVFAGWRRWKGGP